MASLPRALAWLALGALALTAGAAIRLPPLEGSLSGELTPTSDSTLSLRWTLEGRSPGESRRVFDFTVEGDSGRARGQLELAADGIGGAWKLSEAEFLLKPWFTALADRLGSWAPALSVEGRLILNGEGNLVDGQPQGTLNVRLVDGAVKSASQGWDFAGIAGEGSVSLDGTGQFTLSADTGRFAAWGLRNARLGLELQPEQQLRVSELTVSGLGGTIDVLPFTATLSPPAAAFTVRVTGLALSDVSHVLPKTFSEAIGRIDGELHLSWDAVGGVQLGEGWIGLAAGTTASVRLAPVPGLITGQMPSTNPAFAPLQRVELGRTPLDVRVLRAVFTPKGDAQGRSATIRLQAEPSDPLLKAPIILDINVLGPLNELIQLGLDDRLQF